MLIKLVPATNGHGCFFSPVVVLKLSNKKELHYYCGRRKLYNSSKKAFKRAERFISLFNKFAEEGPPKRTPFHVCECVEVGCPCKGDCNNIAVREIEYPDIHQQVVWLCQDCLHEFFCGCPELEEEYGYERED